MKLLQSLPKVGVLYWFDTLKYVFRAVKLLWYFCDNSVWLTT